MKLSHLQIVEIPSKVQKVASVLICWIVKSSCHDIRNKLRNSIFSKLSPHNVCSHKLILFPFPTLNEIFSLKSSHPFSMFLHSLHPKGIVTSLVLDPSVISLYLSAISPLQRFQYHILCWSYHRFHFIMQVSSSISPSF